MKAARQWPRFLLAVLAVVAVLWIAYKATAMRRTSDRLTVDTGCESDPTTVAEMSWLTPGAAPIRCVPWDVGTGVTGYVWQAPNAKAAILIEHGWGDYAQRYVKQSGELIARLLARGITVYAIDMWANGRSPGVRGATNLRDAVEDHLAARRKLKDQSLPLFVLGHSVGGLVTAISTLRDQERVAGMVLIAPALDWRLGSVMRAVARAGAFLLPTFTVPGPPGDPGEQSRDVEFHSRVTQDPLYNRGPISWVTAGTGASISHANWTRYGAITVPVLLVNGTADTVTKPSVGSAFIESVGSHDKTLRLVNGGRHALLDDPPSNVEALLIIFDWLDRRLPNG